MKHSETRIQEEIPQEVLSLAAQLYAQKIQSSSPQELVQAKAAQRIPLEFIQEATVQIQARQTHVQQSQQNKQRQRSLLVLALVLTVAAILSGAVMFWIARMLEPKMATVTTPEQQVPTAKRCQNEPGANFGNQLAGTNLRGRNFCNANLDGAILNNSDLSGVDLSNASLRGAHLNNANLSGANLSGANLEGAYLNIANLSGADLSGANLRGAQLPAANLDRANLDGAVLEGANLNGAAMPNGARDKTSY